MDPIPNLIEAARAGNINGLYEAIKSNPTVLKEIDEIPFVNTPLHEAASAGQTDFALEMMNLAPSFGRKLNPDGLSPLDLALQNNHKDTVKRLVSFDGELVRVKGKERLTPLHRAAESDGEILCLIELLLACPDSIEDLTIHNENALDIARKSSSGAAAFKILYDWVKRSGDPKRLLQKKDADGNSAETYHNDMKQQPKDRKSLCCVKAEKPSAADDDTKNLHVYLCTPERWYESILRRCLQSMLWTQRGLTMDMRNVVLVVAVLIATATFQAIFSPPGDEGGGLASHNNNSLSLHMNNTIVDHNNNSLSLHMNNTIVDQIDQTGGEKFLERGEEFLLRCFYFLNTVAFTASVGVIIMVLPLRFYTCFLHLSLLFMTACYWYALFQTIRRFGLAVAFIYYIGSSIFILIVYYLKVLFWATQSCEPEFLATLLFSRCLKENFRCLNQMGAFTLK